MREARIGDVVKLSYTDCPNLLAYIYEDYGDGMYRACVVCLDRRYTGDDTVDIRRWVFHTNITFPAIAAMCHSVVDELTSEEIGVVHTRIHDETYGEVHITDPIMVEHRQKLMFDSAMYAMESIAFAMDTSCQYVH